MPNEVYAVIFEQGTVKVGMTTFSTQQRVVEHKRSGERFGIKIAKTLTWEAPCLKLKDWESALCGYCAEFGAEYKPGAEWFMFKNPQEAESVLTAAMEKIQNGIFPHDCRKSYLDRMSGGEGGWSTAWQMILNGTDVYEAADKAGIKVNRIVNTNAYKDLMKRRAQNNAG